MKSPKDMRIIQIDITNACVYQCSNCTRFCGHHKKNFFMNYDTFQRAVKSLKGYHGTIGIMGGEPTLHPEFEKFSRFLHTQLPEEIQKKDTSLIKPQKDFIEAVFLENKKNSEVYSYGTGERETITGAGLWSAMVPTYKKHYEIIQDVYKMQAVNDHGNTMYHSPILINRKDLGIPDDEWLKIRDNCWAQETWSATITPKGAFFCEIAGALDMLFDGPGGWPIEEGWWKRTPDQFGDQLHWCEYCGIAIETFTRNANDWIDDVSEGMYEKLIQIESPKLKQPERINLVKIENGHIADESKLGVKEVRHEFFYDSFESRFSKERTILYPKAFSVIIELTEDCEISSIKHWMKEQREQFGTVILCTKSQSLAEEIRHIDDKKLFVIDKNTSWKECFKQALEKCTAMQPIWYFSELLYLKKSSSDLLRNVVFNPGTLHYADMNERSCELFEENCSKGRVCLFHKEAFSLRNMDEIQTYEDILRKWPEQKVIVLSEEMIEDASIMRIQKNTIYAIYGAGPTGRSALIQIQRQDSVAIFFVDSDSAKWGTEIEGVPVLNPEELKARRDDFSKIVIASTYYKAIKEKLESLGFSEEDYIIYE